MYIGICLKGLEEISSEVCKGKKVLSGRVSFSKVEKYRCFDKVYKLEGKFKFKYIDEIVDNVKVSGKFKIVCSREGKHNFKSIEVAGRIAKKFGLDFKNEKVMFVDIVDDNCFYGELIYSDLCKRDYRVKLVPDSLNACLSYCALRLLGVKKSDVVFDPFCRDGVVLIEAALLGCKAHGFEKNVRNARINAKVAKVDVVLDEQEISWAKTRYKENEVLVCSYFPSVSERKRERRIFGLYKEFFDVSSIVKKLCIVCRKKDVLKFAKGFKLIKELEVEKGNEKYYILLFEKTI